MKILYKIINLFYKKIINTITTEGCFDDNCDEETVCSNCKKHNAILEELETKGFEQYSVNSWGLYYYNKKSNTFIKKYHAYGR